MTLNGSTIWSCTAKTSKPKETRGDTDGTTNRNTQKRNEPKQ